MMEESSDESTEIITKEEAELAQKETQDIGDVSSLKTAGVTDQTVPSVNPPMPLPAFMTGSVQPSDMSTPQRQNPPVVSSAATTPVVSNVATTPVIPSAATMPVSSSVVATAVSASAISTPVTPNQIKAPAPVQSPYEASAQIQLPEDMNVEMSPTPGSAGGGGLFGWITGNKIVSKVVEKTKSSMETMITTLDPGMKEVIKSGGDIQIAVTSTKESKVGAIREAFQSIFGHATVIGMESQANTAAQPVGFTAGLKGAEERIMNLRQNGSLEDDRAIVSVEGFIVELLPDRWYEMSCVLLQDPRHRIELQSFSQPTPIPAEYILKAQDATPSDYPQRWSGLKVTIGEVIEQTNPHIGHSDWQNSLVGVSRRETLVLASKTLAFMYQQRLPTSFVS